MIYSSRIQLLNSIVESYQNTEISSIDYTETKPNFD
jgi:hypothetical protein